MESLRRLKRALLPRGFIVLVGSLDQAGVLVAGLPGRAAELARQAWPGPLTLVLPASAAVPEILRPDGLIALRCPARRLLRELALAIPGALVTTSANAAGALAPRTLEEVDPAILAGCAIAVDGGELAGEPSTVVRPEADGRITVLRRGLWPV